MRTHEQFADDLALYALEELSAADHQEFDEHLETCASCRRELQALRGDLALLALSSSGPKPPVRSRDRLLEAIAQEPRRGGAAAGARRSGWWAWIPALAALGMLFITVGVWKTNTRLKDQMAEMSNRYQDQSVQLAQARENLHLLTSTDAMHVSLTPQNAAKHPSATAIYSSNQKRVLLMASNLPPVPEGKAYELWLIPMKGAPMPAGVFKPDEHGNAMMMDHPMPEGVEAKAFAITMENEAGSDKPTSPILLMGAGE